MTEMAVLFWLPLFVCIYCTYGLHLKERINDEIKCHSEDDPRFQLMIVHPFDCSKYFLCRDGVALLEVCPMGLHFNDALQLCDYPEKVNCDRDQGIVECSAEDGTHHLPHPSNCEKFYSCHNGIPHLKNCLLGLHFNARLQVCDYPYRAGCGKIRLSESRDEVIANELIGCLTGRDGKFFIPNPHHCSEYTVCDNGRHITFHNKKCSSGLHFNVFNRTCDLPHRAKCTAESEEQSTNKQDGPDVPSPYCPTVDGKEQIFFHHPSNCSEYYMCAHGRAFKFACPARLHFNLKGKCCDYEWLAQCPTGNGEKKQRYL
ncbi:peritrophin-44 [Parasteatoda tepidariorum]|uniref:peritrophin-44 n=1 Tax=Parasteatoda tepidariorum TaxID=114398 RepID=UPI00077FE1E1|nr:probable chitinase 10 [Parasteatoda tepidariorum]